MLPIIESNLYVVHYAPLAFTGAVFLFTAIGWFFGHYRLKTKREEGVTVRDPLVAAIFGLTALVLGFTFSGSASRYSAQMDGLRVQAQLLSKVYGSLKYLAPDDQISIKKSLDELLDMRLSAFKDSKGMADVDAQAQKILEGTRKLQEQVAVATPNATSKNQVLISELLVPQVRALSASISSGIISSKSHPPTLLMRFLFGLLCITAFLIGYTMAVKSESDWLLATLYTIIIGIALYVILSLELPNLLMPYDEVNRDFLLLKDAVK